jgi:predicted DNA-binding transcriptional regulator AlpA
VLGKNIISYWTVGKYAWMFVLSTTETDIHIVPESDGDFSLDDRTAFLPSEEPFLSVRQIATKVMMSKPTEYRHSRQTMRWKLRHPKCVPYSLTESDKMNRVQRATELLELRQSIRQPGRQYLTLDESQFYWEIDWEQ